MWLEYQDEPPALWSQLLKSVRAEGKRLVRTRVCWGAHEQVRGVRDFSKSSRLRLERFLTACHAEQLSVEIHLGFPPRRDSFPSWAYAQAAKSVIPAGLWEGGDASYMQSSVPSLYDAELMDAFLDFVREVRSLVALYREPEGPVAGVFLDLGLFEHDLSANEAPEFLPYFQVRYAHLDEVNAIYRTSFRDFRAPASANGLRVLAERRPWLAAFDYRWCRHRMLEAIRSRVPELPPPPAMASAPGPWQLAVDSMLFEGESDGCFPLPIGGHVNPTATSAFRLAEYLGERASRAGVPVTWMGLAPTNRPFQADRVLVVCGKYLTRAWWEALRAHADTGAEVTYATGAPHYDENLKSLPVRSGPSLAGWDEALWDRLEGMVKGRC